MHNSVLIEENYKHVVKTNDKLVSFNKSTCDSQNHASFENSSGKKLEHTKTINNVRINGEKPQADQTSNGAKANKDSVIIVGY